MIAEQLLLRLLYISSGEKGSDVVFGPQLVKVVEPSARLIADCYLEVGVVGLSPTHTVQLRAIFLHLRVIISL
jgi:hypothetical protein